MLLHCLCNHRAMATLKHTNCKVPNAGCIMCPHLAEASSTLSCINRELSLSTAGLLCGCGPRDCASSGQHHQRCGLLPPAPVKHHVRCMICVYMMQMHCWDSSAAPAVACKLNVEVQVGFGHPGGGAWQRHGTCCCQGTLHIQQCLITKECTLSISSANDVAKSHSNSNG
jgi:hypothetical protein